MPIEVTRSSRWADLPDLLRVPQVAKYLGMSKFWVYARVKDGTFKQADMGTKTIFIPKELFHPSRLRRHEPEVEEVRVRRLLRCGDPDATLAELRSEQKRRADAAERNVQVTP